jgi:hypothetical protein
MQVARAKPLTRRADRTAPQRPASAYPDGVLELGKARTWRSADYGAALYFACPIVEATAEGSS